ncbi:dynamin-binding protein-like isoform X2 [Hydra vulgaris]|uniref:Dynamin-binding protein n=1 Tax=Hydra vulgaris TaxID=6087 RepID=A0ABM4BXR5_HYDVU
MALGICKALFDFVAERESDLSLHAGDIVFVSKKINNDWYEGFSNNKYGHFPSCYVEMIFNSTPERVGVVISNFKGDQNGHLPLTKGDVIGLIGVIDENFSSGYLNSAKGIFPTNFVKELTIPNNVILPQTNFINNKISSSNDNLDEIEKKKLERSTSYLKTKIKPNILPKPKLKKDKNLIQDDYQFELTDEKIFDICGSVKKGLVVKRKAPPQPIITNVSSTNPNESSVVPSNQINKEVITRKMNQQRSPINIKNSPSISSHSDIQTLSINSLNNNSSTSRSNLMTVSFTKEKQLEFSNGLSDYESDSHLLKESKKSTNKISFDKSICAYSQWRSPNEKQDDQYFVQTINSTEKLNANMQRHDLYQIDTEIAQLKSKLEFESHQLAGVETLLGVVSEDNRKDLYAKQEHHESMINELNDSLHALEDEKSYVLASFGKVEDVKNRVNELEKQIEQYLNNCEQLRCMQDFSDIEELPEIRDNIIFCENMVDTLQDELSGLREKLGELDQFDGNNDPEKMLQKRKKNLCKIVEELITTEENFICDISFLTDKIKVKLENEEAVNVNVLFGNLDEILVVSQKLLLALKNACCDISDQISNKIASCFLALSMEMKECYATYCQNYDDVQNLLEKFEEEPDIQQKISKAFLLEGNNFGSISLSSMLIKPVQRVLKYPLLLNELLKNSLDSESNCELKLALNTMNDVATAINEFKRRKDLVLKYRETVPGIGKKVQKLNWHSVAKKSSRINQRITQFTGLNSHTVDQKFIYEEKRFRTIEKMIKLVLKNVNQYVEIFKDNSFSELQCAESLRQFHDSPNPPDEIVKYYGRIYMIAEQYSSQMGPFRLIQKRNDKCLDFDRAANKAARARDTKEKDKIMQTQDELNVIKNVYIALNTQLLEELPILSDKCSVFLQYCLSSFVEAYNRYFRKCCVQINEVVKLPFLSKDTDTDFFIKASEQLSNLMFTPSLNGKENSKKPFLSTNLMNGHEDINHISPLSSDNGFNYSSFSDTSTLYDSIDQTTSLNSFLHETQSTTASESIAENPICIVKYDFTAECDAEITVQEGTLVNVCRTCDSKGNSDWWLVEQDGVKGYIPHTFLIMKSANEKYLTCQTQSENLRNDQHDKNTTFKVEYNFQAINPGELTVNEGQTVRVLRKHDSKGNNEWWLVEYDGKQGFVPQDYLKSKNKP